MVDAQTRTRDAVQRRILGLPLTAEGVVVGAPGTGKTETLVERAAAVLRELDPAAMLVLTPTRQTATALRDRVALRAGVATGGPVARSVASFAYDVVRAAAAAAGAPPPRLLTGSDQDRMFAELLDGDEADEATGIRRWPVSIGAVVRRSRSFRTELRTLLAEAVELGIGPSELDAIAVATGQDAWRAAASFHRDVLDVRDAMGAAAREPGELAAEAAALLADSRSAVGVAAGLRVVLVDDAQELTRSGIDLVIALRRRGAAILAFGDPDISSGAFRGATPDLFAELSSTLGDVHVLDGPHRQTAELTRLTRTVTSAIGVAGRVEHRRPPGPEPEAPTDDVRVIHAPSPSEEVDHIARTLREWHVLHGIAWDEMAVIAHDTRQVSDLATELAAREVPVRSAGVRRALADEPVVRDLLRLVRVGITPPAERDPDDIAAALLSPFGGLDAVGLRRVRARLRHVELAAGGSRPARELLADAMAAPLELGLLDLPEARIAERLARTLASLRVLGEEHASVHELLWHAWQASRDRSGRRVADVWRELAVSGGVLSAEADRSLDAIVALFDVAKRDDERQVRTIPTNFIGRLLGSDVADDTLAAPPRPGTVALLTPAGALGTEFEAVVVAGVQDGVWPNVRLRGGLLDTWRLAEAAAAWRSGERREEVARVDRRRAALHDELRLFARAVSRARRRLVVTAVNDDDLGPSPLFGFLPSADDVLDGDEASGHPLTLRGLVARHRRILTTTHDEERRRASSGQLRALAHAGVPGADPAQWFGIGPPTSTAPLRDPARGPVHVSPSRLDAFEDCQLDWAITVLGGGSRTWSAGVGTILHAALEEVPGGDLAELQEVVDSRWGELDFDAPWMSAKEHAWATLLVGRLHAYLRRFHAEGGRTTAAESEFRIAIDLTADAVPRVVGDPEPGQPVALLSGTVDRIEVFAADAGEDLPAGAAGRERAVIVDLKTGRSEARVSDDKVADDPQLAAYQLAMIEGHLPGVEEADSAGARLLVLSKTLKGGSYRLARQAPMGPEERSAFVARIAATAREMASARFAAHLDTHCRVDRFAVCPVHTVKAVSAS